MFYDLANLKTKLTIRTVCYFGSNVAFMLPPSAFCECLECRHICFRWKPFERVNNPNQIRLKQLLYKYIWNTGNAE